MKSILRLILLALSLLMVTACPRQGLPPESFSLSLMPETLQLLPRQEAAATLSLNRRSGFTDPVSLSVVGAPEGITAEFKPDTVFGNSSTLVISGQINGQGGAPGLFELTLSGRAQGQESRATLTVRVGPRGDEGAMSIAGQVTTSNAEIPIRPEAAAFEATAALPQAPGNGPAYVPGELLIRYREGDALGRAGLGRGSEHYLETARAVARDFGLQALRAGDPSRPDLVRVSGQDLSEVVGRLSRDPRVLYAEPNYYLYTQATQAAQPAQGLYSTYTTRLPDDPRLGEQWALAAAGLPVAWEAGASAGASVVVAVIDSGFDLGHEDLRSRFLPGYDFCNLRSGSCSATAPTDADPGFGESGNFHGTHVAGIIAATSDNGLGIAGVVRDANVRLLPVKIFNDSGGGATTSTFIDGIRWAAGLTIKASDGKRINNPNPARIINLSLGGDISSRAMQEAIDNARAQGATVIAATGNNGFERVLSPAAADGVIGVGSHNQLFGRSCFSNYGTSGPNGPGGVDIVAPGGEGNGTAVSCGLLGAQRQAILSTVPENSYSFSAGTSMAAPMVAGVAALILSRQPELSPEALEEQLLTTSYFDPETMSTDEYGAGVLRADRALGLPGPGDPVALYALGPHEGRSGGTGLAVLDLYGGSDPYRLEGLSSGSYTVRAGAHGPGALYGERSVLVPENTSQEQITIRLERQR